MQRNLVVLRRWWWLLVGSLLVGGIVAYGATKVLVKTKYQGTAVIAMAPSPPGPNGPYYFSLLAATADAQLVATLSTAQHAARYAPGVDPTQLSSNTTASPSVDGQLLSIMVQWSDRASATRLANAVARAFIVQERTRLKARYRLIHSGLLKQEAHLTELVAGVRGNGAAQDWLRSKYADTGALLYQQDASASIEAGNQAASLQLAQPATTATALGPKASINAILGAVLGLLIASVIAFLATTSYDERSERAAISMLS